MNDKFLRNYKCEVRAEQNEEHGDYITGQPIVFGASTDIGGMYEEIIDEGALDNADLKDVRFLVNHNLDMIPLARSSLLSEKHKHFYSASYQHFRV